MREYFVAGDIGSPVITVGFPDDTLKAAITTAIAEGTKMDRKFVKASTGANFEVAACDDGDVPEGRIVSYEKTTTLAGVVTYLLSIEWFWYTDAAAAVYPVTRMITVPYATGGSPALGNTVAVDSSTYTNLKDATSTGAGRIIGIDTTNLKLSVLT